MAGDGVTSRISAVGVGLGVLVEGGVAVGSGVGVLVAVGKGEGVSVGRGDSVGGCRVLVGTGV